MRLTGWRPCKVCSSYLEHCVSTVCIILCVVLCEFGRPDGWVGCYFSIAISVTAQPVDLLCILTIMIAGSGIYVEQITVIQTGQNMLSDDFGDF